jgi:hypothetical protein
MIALALQLDFLIVQWGSLIVQQGPFKVHLGSFEAQQGFTIVNLVLSFFQVGSLTTQTGLTIIHQGSLSLLKLLPEFLQGRKGTEG